MSKWFQRAGHQDGKCAAPGGIFELGSRLYYTTCEPDGLVKPLHAPGIMMLRHIRKLVLTCATTMPLAIAAVYLMCVQFTMIVVNLSYERVRIWIRPVRHVQDTR